LTPFSFCLVAAERTAIFVQCRRYWQPPKQISTSVRRHFLHYVEAQFTPHHGKISPPVASPRKSQRTIFKSSDRWRPPPTVAPHINLCESAHKNKKSKHNNQPNASSRSRCRRPPIGRHQPPTEAQKKVNIYRAYCLFHFIIFILHHPNVVLCRYHRRRIDKGGSTEAHCGSMPYKGGGRGEREPR